MVFILGASSLRNTIQGLPYTQRRTFLGSSFYLGGLTFDSSRRDKSKIVQIYLNGGSLEKKRKLVIWHDLINNSLTPFEEKVKSGRKTPRRSLDTRSHCPPCSKKETPEQVQKRIAELVDTIKSFKDRIEAIVYIKRFGAPDALKQLRSTGVVVIDAFNQLISHRNRKNARLLNDLRKLHPEVKSEARILKVVWKRRNKLQLFGPKQFAEKRKIKKIKPSQKERRKKQKPQASN